MAIIRLGTRMSTLFDQELTRLDLSAAQLRILSLVGQDGPLMAARIAEELLIEPATVSLHVKRLVAKGWLERVPGPDRRSVCLQLTQAGQEVVRAAVPIGYEMASSVMHPMGFEQKALLRHALEHLEARLRSISSEEGFSYGK